MITAIHSRYPRHALLLDSPAKALAMKQTSTRADAHRRAMVIWCRGSRYRSARSLFLRRPREAEGKAGVGLRSEKQREQRCVCREGEGQGQGQRQRRGDRLWVSRKGCGVSPARVGRRRVETHFCSTDGNTLSTVQITYDIAPPVLPTHLFYPCAGHPRTPHAGPPRTKLT